MSSTHRVKLLRCFMSTDLAELEFEDGSRRLVQHKAAEYVRYEGSWGLAVLDGDRLVEFRSEP